MLSKRAGRSILVEIARIEKRKAKLAADRDALDTLIRELDQQIERLSALLKED